MFDICLVQVVFCDFCLISEKIMRSFRTLLSSVMDEFVGQTMLGVYDAPFSL